MSLTEVTRFKCAATRIVDPSEDEQDFLLLHIQDLDLVRGVRAWFEPASGMPMTFGSLLIATASEFQASAQALAQKLHGTMRSRGRATDCILAVLGLDSSDTGTTNSVAVLKLDTDHFGAQADRDADGVVQSLAMLTELLPQPGKLAKALLWPDPRGGGGVYLRDRGTTAEPAAYFPEAYELLLGTTPAAAETALVEVVLADPNSERRTRALASMDVFAGSVTSALEMLSGLQVPMPVPLPDDLVDGTVSVRSARALRRKVRIEADWLSIEVPIGREDDISVVANSNGTWTVTATVGVEPPLAVDVGSVGRQS